jgi:hypothetical protein
MKNGAETPASGKHCSAARQTARHAERLHGNILTKVLHSATLMVLVRTEHAAYQREAASSMFGHKSDTIPSILFGR